MKILAEAGFVIRTVRRMSDRVLLGERGLKTDGIMLECRSERNEETNWM